MNEQSNPLDDLLKYIKGLFVEHLPEIAEDVIHDILHKHEDEICEKAAPVMKAAAPPTGDPIGKDPTKP